MNENNETLKTTFAAAIENYKKRDFKTAEIYCYKILSIDSNHFDSISLLANINAISRNFDKAKELYIVADELTIEPVTEINLAMNRIDGLIEKRDEAREQMNAK